MVTLDAPSMPGNNYQTLWIPCWHPATLNQLLGGHWSKGARMKKSDREIVCTYARLCGLREACNQRRVSLHMVLRAGQRAPDRDCWWKSCLDALVQAGLLCDDNPRYCTTGEVVYTRTMDAEFWGTMILLEDLT